MATSRLLGIEVGATKLQLVIGDAAGRIHQRERRTVDRSRAAAGIREQIAQVIAQWCMSFEWQAVGVGFGGPVDGKTGRIARSCHIEGWDDFPLGDWLAKLTNTPVIVENDTNAAALGESIFGAGCDANPVFYTNSGSGVGGGLVVDGRIYHGATPGEAEFGHLRFDKSGTIVEDRCSGWALDRRVRAAAVAGGSVLSELIPPGTGGGEARHLSAAIMQGDPIAETILTGAADDLAFALSHVVHLFHPQVVILGGGVSLIGEPWRAAIARALPRYLMTAFQPGPPVRLSALGENVVPVGALACARELVRSVAPARQPA